MTGDPEKAMEGVLLVVDGGSERVSGGGGATCGDGEMGGGGRGQHGRGEGYGAVQQNIQKSIIL